MPDKRHIRQNIKRLQVIKTWQLLILLILSLFLTATFLRLNNTGMLARRNAVAGADKSGNVEEITSRIYDLQRYSSSHMNADTGVFYLQNQYDRAVKAAAAKAGSGDADSPQARADAICNPNLQVPGYSQAYQDCMLRELTKAGQVVDPASIKPPSPSLFRYEFTSPIWSPDFAGWSAIVSIILILMIIGRLITLAILRVLLHRHYKHL